MLLRGIGERQQHRKWQGRSLPILTLFLRVLEIWAHKLEKAADIFRKC